MAAVRVGDDAQVDVAGGGGDQVCVENRDGALHTYTLASRENEFWPDRQNFQALCL